MMTLKVVKLRLKFLKIISSAQEEFIPPCLKYIEREYSNSSLECSNAYIAANSSTVSVVTNSSSEDPTSITDNMQG